MYCKKTIIFALLIASVLFVGCSKTSTSVIDKLNAQIDELKQENEQLKEKLATPAPEKTIEPKTVTFTNKFGTATTKCVHSGCSSYIASSGDTNCCPTHSNKCAECRAYIDEDALWCMSCLTKGLK